MERPRVTPLSSDSSTTTSGAGTPCKKPRKKAGFVKKTVIIGAIGLASAIGINMLTDGALNPFNSGPSYEEKRDQKLNAFHSDTEKMIDQFADNMADIMDPSRAGQYRNDLAGSMEDLLEAALIHNVDDVNAPIQTSMADRSSMSLVANRGYKVVFDSQLTEYGAVYHPEQQVVAINANVPLQQAAVYARNAIHHISYATIMDARTKGKWKVNGGRPEGAKLLLESNFAIDKNATARQGVQGSVLQGGNLPSNFNPPAPPIKAPGS